MFGFIRGVYNCEFLHPVKPCKSQVTCKSPVWKGKSSLKPPFLGFPAKPVKLVDGWCETKSPRVWTPLLAAAEMAHLDTLQVLLDVTLIAIKKFEKELNQCLFSCSSSCFLFCSLSMFSWFLFCIVLMMAVMVVADNLVAHGSEIYSCGAALQHSTVTENGHGKTPLGNHIGGSLHRFEGIYNFICIEWLLRKKFSNYMLDRIWIQEHALGY